MRGPRYFNGLHINIQFSKDGFVNLHRTEEHQVSKSGLTQCEDGTMTKKEDVVCGARGFAWIFYFVTHLRKTKTTRQVHGGVDPKQNMFEYCRLFSVVREDRWHETDTHTCKKKCQTKKHNHDIINDPLRKLRTPNACSLSEQTNYIALLDKYPRSGTTNNEQSIVFCGVNANLCPEPIFTCQGTRYRVECWKLSPIRNERLPQLWVLTALHDTNSSKSEIVRMKEGWYATTTEPEFNPGSEFQTRYWNICLSFALLLPGRNLHVAVLGRHRWRIRVAVISSRFSHGTMLWNRINYI